MIEVQDGLEAIDGVRILTPHGCRHTYVSQMQALGVDLATIQSIVGHADVDMTQHYLHVQEPIRQDAIARFADAFGEQPDSDPEPPEDEASCTIISPSNVYEMNNRDSGQDSGQKKLRNL